MSKFMLNNNTNNNHGNSHHLHLNGAHFDIKRTNRLEIKVRAWKNEFSSVVIHMREEITSNNFAHMPASGTHTTHSGTHTERERETDRKGSCVDDTIRTKYAEYYIWILKYALICVLLPIHHLSSTHLHTRFFRCRKGLLGFVDYCWLRHEYNELFDGACARTW